MQMGPKMSWEEQMEARLDRLERAVVGMRMDVDLMTRYIREVATVMGALSRLEAIDQEFEARRAKLEEEDE